METLFLNIDTDVSDPRLVGINWLTFHRRAVCLLRLTPRRLFATRDIYPPISVPYACLSYPVPRYIQALLVLPYIVGKQFGAHRILRRALLNVVYEFGRS